MLFAHDGVEQPASLDAERRIVGKGGKEGDVLLGEGLPPLADQEPDADRLFVQVKGHAREGLPAMAAGKVPLRGPGVLLEIDASQGSSAVEQLPSQPAVGADPDLAHRLLGHAPDHLNLQLLAGPVE